MSDSVGTAFLTLVPKLDKGFASKAESSLAKSGDAGGQKFSDNFSTKMSSAFKKLAGAAIVVKAGQTLGEQFMEAFNGYANFEQLDGGVRKIFGDGMYSQIMSDANDAYKNLNMSANQYLETINDVGANFKSTMGEQKGYEVAKQGLQAISDYASGTGKNVDELKEKFGMITRATSSYQSIADQFSGILPATSEGFLKQAQAAKLLSGDYEKLTEVPIDEYQAAIAAMLEKGTSDLGLASNTVNETMGTLSGSLAGAKAAWSDFLVSLGNPDADMSAATSKLAEMVVAAGQQVVQAAGRIVTTVGENFPTWMSQIADFVSANAPQLGVAVGNLIADVAGWIVDNLPTIAAAAGEMFQGLLVGLAVATANATYRLIEWVSKAVGKVASSAGKMVNAAKTFMGGVVSGIGAKASSVMSAITKVLTSIPGKITSFVGKMRSAAGDLIRGMAAGLTPGAITAKIHEICDGAVSQIKAFFHIKSPSRVTRKLFGYVGDGMVLGLDDSKRGVERAMDRINESVTGSVADYGIGMSTPLVSANGLAAAGAGGSVNNTINLYYNAPASAAQMASDLAREVRRTLRRG